jgi:hypothetical protein
VIRLRRTRRSIPLIRFYELELSPPDAEVPWRPGKPVSGLGVRRRLYAEGYYQRDVADMLLEADQLWDSGNRDGWVEHSGVRPAPRDISGT